MSVNKYKPHVHLIPEDEANRQVAVGFLNHDAVAVRNVELRPPAGGWLVALGIFETEYLKLVRENSNAHVVLLIDFDNDEQRMTQSLDCIPLEVRPRVIVISSKNEPEDLKAEIGKSFEKIGMELAHDCFTGGQEHWTHSHLLHNADELKRMIATIKPILFP